MMQFLPRHHRRPPSETPAEFPPLPLQPRDAKKQATNHNRAITMTCKTESCKQTLEQIIDLIKCLKKMFSFESHYTVLAPVNFLSKT